MSISVVVGIQTIEDHRERDKMKTILVIASVLFTVGSTLGIEILSFESHHVARSDLRIMQREYPRQFSDLSNQQKTNFSTLMKAIRDNELSFVRDLLGQDNSIINIEDQYGRIPLTLALLQKHDNIAICLVEHGADVNQMNRYGANPLLSTESIDMAEYLFQHKADLNYVDEDQDTLLHLAVESGKKHLVEWLIEKGLCVNQKNQFDKTALCLAVQRTDKNIVESLLKKHAKIDEAILKSAAAQCRLAKERYLRLSIPDSTADGTYLSEELQSCQEILRILESHFIANQIR